MNLTCIGVSSVARTLYRMGIAGGVNGPARTATKRPLGDRGFTDEERNEMNFSKSSRHGSSFVMVVQWTCKDMLEVFELTVCSCCFLHVFPGCHYHAANLKNPK